MSTLDFKKIVKGNKITPILIKLCENGPRLQGTNATQKAFSFILDYFIDLGLHVSTQKCNYFEWHPGPSKINFGQKSTKVDLMINSPSACLDAQLIDGAYGYPDEIESCEGKIILVKDDIRPSSKQIPRKIKYEIAQNNGAKGIIFISKWTGRVEVGCIGDLTNAKIPAISITPELGHFLKLRVGEKINIETKTFTQPSNFSNIIIETEPNLKAISLSAHYDTVHTSPGAIDNTTGIILLILISQYYLKNEIPLNFYFFGAEELGAIGSINFASYQSKIKNIKALLNLDCFGIRNSSWKITTQDSYILNAFNTSMAELELQEGLDYRIKRNVPLGTDAEAFAKAGVPSSTFSCDIDAMNPSICHTRYDTVDKVSSLNLKVAFMIISNIIQNLNSCTSF